MVIDLGFGDAGKGTTTDFLVRGRAADTVVRFNGGAQAGHNVLTDDGRHHTFSQLGAGAFCPGVSTHLSRFMVVHPTALLVEASRLQALRVPEPLAPVTLSEHALVTTPYVQALVGVGETQRISLEQPDLTIRVRDLALSTDLARLTTPQLCRGSGGPPARARRPGSGGSPDAAVDGDHRRLDAGDRAAAQAAALGGSRAPPGR